MSIYAMAPVWKADLKPNHKFVLLAYADSAREDGTKSWPGWDALVEMTGYSKSTIAGITRELIALGVLVQTKRGMKGQRAEYTIDLRHPLISGSEDDTLFTGSRTGPDRVQNTDDRVQPVGPLPSSSPVLPSRPSTHVGRKPDLLWEAFVAVHGEPATESERGKYNRTVKSLRDAAVTPDEYPALVAAFTTKHNGLQPAVVTVSERVGELRHFITRGPVTVRSIDEVEADRRWAALESRAIGGGGE